MRITEEGRRRHDDVAARRSIAMMHILSAFEPQERAQLAGLLDRLIASIDDVVERLDGPAGAENADDGETN